MTNKEMMQQAYLGLAALEDERETYKAHALPVPEIIYEGIKGLETVIAALESESLAVLFEGWISDNELGMTAKELASGYTYLRLSRNREQPTDHAVLLTLTPRKGESDDA